MDYQTELNDEHQMILDCTNQVMRNIALASTGKEMKWEGFFENYFEEFEIVFNGSPEENVNKLISTYEGLLDYHLDGFEETARELGRDNAVKQMYDVLESID